MRQLIRAACPLVSALLLLGAVACGSTTPSTPTVPVDPNVLPAMSLMLAEKSMGSPTAPNTIIEYESFMCPHCADFHRITLPDLKAQYIDKGLVKYVVRDAPLNQDLDLTAAMLARCAGDRYFEAVDALYAGQATWSGGGASALDNVMRQSGMSQPAIDACKASTTLRNGILQVRQDGLNQWHFQGVPAFIVNDQKLADGMKYIADFLPYLH